MSLIFKIIVVIFKPNMAQLTLIFLEVNLCVSMLIFFERYSENHMVLLRMLFYGVVLYLLPVSLFASEYIDVVIVSCLLPGKSSGGISLSIDSETKEIKYIVKRMGLIESINVFNEGNKLKRFTDSQMGITYYGFRLGEYGYIIDIINGSEKNEYTISFDIKNNKVIQSSDCLPNSFRSDNIRSD
ncbi:hypothetical protein [Kosakonia pseudosacchari]|uniref:hypothetical protein n=1 Tax=Kosakonia pseudosacchari TaxID=1646340 RepID=UPI000A3B1A04|nr:hypothetical protein [Kosakonia pseudosacchari]